jgi:hypothetical protein
VHLCLHDLPVGNGYTKIYSTGYAFAALKADGAIKSWGDLGHRGTAPSGNGYTKIYSTESASALRAAKALLVE